MVEIGRAVKMSYIHELADWPDFHWRDEALVMRLADVRHRQGRLVGRMEALGFPLRDEAVLHTLTEDVIKSSDIEGEKLDRDQVRPSIARHLGLDIGGLIPTDRDVEGVVEMMLDATQNYTAPLNAERLYAWHAALFSTGRSGMTKITVGAWRTDDTGPMQIVSGPIGKEHVHYQAPSASQLDKEMARFFGWFEENTEIDPVLKAGIAHLWFVTIHPFDDGNGRIARAIADLALARAEKTAQRFYSMSAKIRAERKGYYDILENTQKGELDITPWLEWFIDCLSGALDGADGILADVLAKARFWEAHASESLNERQQKIVNRLLDGFDGKLTTSKWAKIAKCSSDTALRDINDLIGFGILKKDLGGGRSTSFSLISL